MDRLGVSLAKAKVHQQREQQTLHPWPVSMYNRRARAWAMYLDGLMPDKQINPRSGPANGLLPTQLTAALTRPATSSAMRTLPLRFDAVPSEHQSERPGNLLPSTTGAPVFDVAAFVTSASALLPGSSYDAVPTVPRGSSLLGASSAPTLCCARPSAAASQATHRHQDHGRSSSAEPSTPMMTPITTVEGGEGRAPPSSQSTQEPRDSPDSTSPQTGTSHEDGALELKPSSEGGSMGVLGGRHRAEAPGASPEAGTHVEACAAPECAVHADVEHALTPVQACSLASAPALDRKSGAFGAFASLRQARGKGAGTGNRLEGRLWQPSGDTSVPTTAGAARRVKERINPMAPLLSRPHSRSSSPLTQALQPGPVLTPRMPGGTPTGAHPAMAMDAPVLSDAENEPLFLTARPDVVVAAGLKSAVDEARAAGAKMGAKGKLLIDAAVAEYDKVSASQLGLPNAHANVRAAVAI